MRPDDRIRLQHMLEAGTKAKKLAEQHQLEDLKHDELLLFALIKYLEVIGEAASKVSPETAQAHPTVTWREIVAMRNHLIHVYFDVNVQIVWQTVEQDLPPLIAKLERILQADHD